MNVLTIGTFDVLHAGHVNFLHRASLMGSSLSVGVLSDRFVNYAKGEFPVFNQRERMEHVALTGFVDNVWLEEGHVETDEDEGLVAVTHPDAILTYAPCTVAVGTDWLTRDYLSRLGISEQGLRDNGITVAFLPYTDGVSTSEIRSRLQ